MPANMLLHPAVERARVRRVEAWLRTAAFVSLGFLGREAGAEAQPPDQVRLSLLEASAPAAARSCTLEVVLDKAGGEAILSCERSAPVSHLAAHRALTASEAGRLYALASVPASSRPTGSGNPATANAAGARVTITIERGGQRVVVDASDAEETLSADHRQTLQVLREIADGLRGAPRR
jgi:hypothetical protein